MSADTTGTAGSRIPVRWLDPWLLGIFATAAVLALPLVVVAGYATLGEREVWDHLVDTVLGEYLAHSAWLALGVGAGTVLLGTITAWLTACCDFPGRRWFGVLLLLPLALPAFIVAYTYTGVLDFAGPVQSGLRHLFDWQPGDYWFPEVRSLGGAIVVLSLVLYPYVYLLTRTALSVQSAALINVARSLGAGPAGVCFRVALPMARPAVLAGLALVLMETLADYGTVKYFAVTTFTTGIFRTWLGMGDAAAAAQLAASLLTLMLILLLIERWSRRQRRFHPAGGSESPQRYRLSGVGAAAALVACGLPVLLGFVVPVAQLTAWSLDSLGSQWTRGFSGLVGNSLAVASLTAALAVILSALLGFGQRLRPAVPVRGAIRLAGSGYAIPGAVIAVGVIIPFSWLDNALDARMEAWFGLSTGLLLTGSLFALVFAYLVRFLSVSLQTVESGFSAIGPGVDDTALSLGCRRSSLLWRVHGPLLRGSLGTAALLVFVDVMKELPATLILRPFDFNTLAVRAFELAEDEQLAAAAPSALAIVLVGLLPVLLLSRTVMGSRRDRVDARA